MCLRRSREPCLNPNASHPTQGITVGYAMVELEKMLEVKVREMQLGRSATNDDFLRLAMEQVRVCKKDTERFPNQTLCDTKVLVGVFDRDVFKDEHDEEIGNSSADDDDDWHVTSANAVEVWGRFREAGIATKTVMQLKALVKVCEARRGETPTDKTQCLKRVMGWNDGAEFYHLGFDGATWLAGHTTNDQPLVALLNMVRSMPTLLDIAGALANDGNPTPFGTLCNVVWAMSKLSTIRLNFTALYKLFSADSRDEDGFGVTKLDCPDWRMLQHRQGKCVLVMWRWFVSNVYKFLEARGLHPSSINIERFSSQSMFSSNGVPVSTTVLPVNEFGIEWVNPDSFIGTSRGTSYGLMHNRRQPGQPQPRLLEPSAEDAVMRFAQHGVGGAGLPNRDKFFSDATKRKDWCWFNSTVQWVCRIDGIEDAIRGHGVTETKVGGKKATPLQPRDAFEAYLAVQPSSTKTVGVADHIASLLAAVRSGSVDNGDLAACRAVCLHAMSNDHTAQDNCRDAAEFVEVLVGMFAEAFASISFSDFATETSFSCESCGKVIKSTCRSDDETAAPKMLHAIHDFPYGNDQDGLEKRRLYHSAAEMVTAASSPTEYIKDHKLDPHAPSKKQGKQRRNQQPCSAVSGSNKTDMVCGKAPEYLVMDSRPRQTEEGGYVGMVRSQICNKITFQGAVYSAIAWVTGHTTHFTTYCIDEHTGLWDHFDDSTVARGVDVIHSGGGQDPIKMGVFRKVDHGESNSTVQETPGANTSRKAASRRLRTGDSARGSSSRARIAPTTRIPAAPPPYAGSSAAAAGKPTGGTDINAASLEGHSLPPVPAIWTADEMVTPVSGFVVFFSADRGRSDEPVLDGHHFPTVNVEMWGSSYRVASAIYTNDVGGVDSFVYCDDGTWLVQDAAKVRRDKVLSKLIPLGRSLVSVTYTTDTDV